MKKTLLTILILSAVILSGCVGADLVEDCQNTQNELVECEQVLEGMAKEIIYD